MPIALLLQIAQALAAGGTFAVDINQIAEAMKKRGDTHTTPAETAKVQAVIAAHVQAVKGTDDFTGTDFLTHTATGA